MTTATRWTCLLSALSLLCACPDEAGAARGFADRQLTKARVRAAWDARHDALERRFRDAGAAWPAEGIFVRAFKAERRLELWAAPATAGERWVRVDEVPLCATSGVLGPKRRSGDLQMPEGFYRIDRFNPWSRFHLSLGLDYPNAVDRVRAAGGPPGGDIFVHGSCVTIGCLPIEDGPIEDLYLAAVLARDGGQHSIPVHVFPCRLDQASCQQTLRTRAEGDVALELFWRSLEAGYERFLETGAPPRVVAEPAGYRLLPDGHPGV